MAAQTTYPLSLNGDTFNGLKTDFDTLLRQLLNEMENRDEEEASITIKVGVKLERDKARDFQANGYDAMRDIIKPTFKHDISTVMQVKNKKSGTLGGAMEMVWDRELCQYVMRPIDNGQVSMFDESDNKATDDERNGNTPPALPGHSDKIIDVDYEAVGDASDGDEPEDNSGVLRADQKALFEYMKQFVGAKMNVLEADGNYTARTLDNKVVLSSACRPTDRFYCSPEKLAPHMGHSIICIGSPSDEYQFESISIWCNDCDEIIFELQSTDWSGDEESADTGDGLPAEGDPDDYPYENPDKEDEES